jgi:hypothetical protein
MDSPACRWCGTTTCRCVVHRGEILVSGVRWRLATDRVTMRCQRSDRPTRALAPDYDALETIDLRYLRYPRVLAALLAGDHGPAARVIAGPEVIAAANARAPRDHEEAGDGTVEWYPVLRIAGLPLDGRRVFAALVPGTPATAHAARTAEGQTALLLRERGFVTLIAALRDYPGLKAEVLS